MAKGKPWTDEELHIIVQIYLDLLCNELDGVKINKSSLRRATLPKLDGRTAGSYEMKMCNISAALDSLELKWIKGYKPLPGYQRSIFDEIKRQLAARPFLRHIMYKG